ncbi:MAG: THAP domain-containing protein, partial [Kangiellaceae bacterium]|nr:THAP domain-containing protein [Kangiellaceae bacterium]
KFPPPSNPCHSQWVAFVRHTGLYFDESSYTSKRICSAHFSEECFEPAPLQQAKLGNHDDDIIV